MLTYNRAHLFPKHVWNTSNSVVRKEGFSLRECSVERHILGKHWGNSVLGVTNSRLLSLETERLFWPPKQSVLVKDEACEVQKLVLGCLANITTRYGMHMLLQEAGIQTLGSVCQPTFPREAILSLWIIMFLGVTLLPPHFKAVILLSSGTVAEWNDCSAMLLCCLLLGRL